jgi:hypothetical protein
MMTKVCVYDSVCLCEGAQVRMGGEKGEMCMPVCGCAFVECVCEFACVGIV